MTIENLGKVLPIARGQYSASVQYAYLDMVSDSTSGSSYIYKSQTPTTGTPLSNETYWQLYGDVREAVKAAKDGAAKVNEVLGRVETSLDELGAAEAGRVSAETNRVSTEQLRVTSEAGRVSAEAGRVSGESGRVSAENSRVSKETARATAETTREANENARKTEETVRVAAEKKRQEDSATAIAGAQVAAQGAIDAKADLAATALRTSASTWDFHVDGNPVMANPAAGGIMQVVADKDCTVVQYGINIIDKNKSPAYAVNTSLTVLDTGLRATSTVAGSNISHMGYIDIGPYSIFAGKILRLTVDMKESALNKPNVNLISANDNYTSRASFFSYGTSGRTNITVPNNPPVGHTRLAVGFYATQSGTVSIGDYVDYTNLQLKFGSEDAPYEPFAAFNTYSLIANTPTEIKAIQGENHLFADNDAWLSVGFNRTSIDVAKIFTVPVTATGAVAQIDHCEKDFALDVTARAIATQEGTGDPSPENVRPIVGKSTVSIWRGGKNLIGYSENPLTKNGIAVTYNANGSITLSGTATARAYAKFSNFAQKRKLLPGTYTLSVGANIPVGCSVLLGHYNAEMIYTGNLIGLSAGQFSKTVTLAKETDFLDGYFDVAAGTTVNITIYPQLELGTTATPYEPYVGHTYPIALPEPLYGRAGYESVLDIKKGVGSIHEKGIVLNGSDSEGWAVAFPGSWTSTYARFYTALPIGPNAVRIATDRCSHFAYGGAALDGYYPNMFFVHTNGLLYVGTEISGVTDLASWKAWLAANPITVGYALATPQTFIFPPVPIPARPGYNASFSDAGGDTTVTGRQGLSAIVKRLAALEDKATQH